MVPITMNDRDTAVHVVIPCSNQNDPDPDLLETLRELGSILNVSLCVSHSALAGEARNVGVVGKFTTIKPPEIPYRSVLFLDSDVVPTSPQLLELFSRAHEHGPGLYSAAYRTRDDQHKVAAGYIDGVRVRAIRDVELRPEMTVDWIGGGCMLVLDCLGSVDSPWFHDSIVRFSLGGEDHAIIVGEDITFCFKAKQVGLPITLFGDVVVEHRIVTRGGNT